MFYVVLVLLMIFATSGSISRKLKAVVGKIERKPRHLPSDLLILQTFLKITDPVTRRMFAIMAVFGLRNHEVPTADLSPLQEGEYYILVTDGKTGAREAWALHPEWIEQFGLRDLQEPFVLPQKPTTDALGAMVTKAFKKANILFDPYDLRHCWARRSIGQLDARLAAAALGHSLAEHYKTYNRWFTFNDLKHAYQRLLNDPNRLRPPEVDQA